MCSTILENRQNPDFVKILEYGIKAPSGHNTQPWKFKTNKTSIEVYPNLTKKLPIIDGNYRELYMSLGCAVENICIASNEFGYAYQIKIINQANIFFIKIELKKTKNIKNPLFTQIDKRQTNRSVYNAKNISPDTIAKLKKIKIELPISVHFYKKGTYDFTKLCELIYKGNEILFTNKDFKAELIDWMRFNAKHIQKEKDGLAYNVLGFPSLPKWFAKLIVKNYLKPKFQNKSEEEKLESSSHLVLITTKKNIIENWILAGLTLERFFLKCTELGIDVAFANQPCEVDELASKIRTEFKIDNHYPILLMRIGYAQPMPYSARKGTNTKPNTLTK